MKNNKPTNTYGTCYYMQNGYFNFLNVAKTCNYFITFATFSENFLFFFYHFCNLSVNAFQRVF